MRQAVQRYLTQRGFRCDAFASGHDALRTLAREPPPDAILTEVLLDGMSGLDLLRAVRSDARLCAVPVVLVTARGLTADRIAGFNAGASAYVSKPFEPEELLATLRAVLSNVMLAQHVSTDVRSEVHALRQDVASMRQLLQAVLLQASGTGTAPPAQQQQPQYYVAPTDQAPTNGGPAAQLPPGVGGALSTDDGVSDAQRALQARLPVLTRRERSVLELVGEGKLNKEIAAELGVGLRYVEKVVKRLLEKTDTPNRTALVRRALQIGLLTNEPDGAMRPVFVPAAPPPQQQLEASIQPDNQLVPAVPQEERLGVGRGHLKPGRPRKRQPTTTRRIAAADAKRDVKSTKRPQEHL